MSAIVLATLNAKWIHASFGLRCLLANLGELRGHAALVEGTLQERTLDFVERILAHGPRVVGLGVYVWNARESELAVAALKRIAPEVVVVLGGPEVSHETEAQRVCQLADYVIRGEGDLAFAELCRELLAGRRPSSRVIDAPLPDLAALASPYREYDETDLRHRVVYVEASRGCPYSCEFCLSALDEKVRAFPLASFLAELDALLAPRAERARAAPAAPQASPAQERSVARDASRAKHGVASDAEFLRGRRSFKFVDRTFNLSPATSGAILEFFLARSEHIEHLHFELVPERLPDALLELLARFAPGVVQLEVGIQTFDAATARRISRPHDGERIERNLRALRERTGVHLHTDLIAGLPGEDVASFARGFDRLVALRPHEIQVGILKRLRGAPIARHDGEYGMRYAEHPPYEVLSTGAITFAEMQRLRRFARAWDLVGNSGNFARTAPLLWSSATPFDGVMAFAEALHMRHGALHGIALDALARELFEHLIARGVPRALAGCELFADYERTRPAHWPEFLREFAGDGARRDKAAPPPHGSHARQRRAHAPRYDPRS